jgi:hypothetical protein
MENPELTSAELSLFKKAAWFNFTTNGSPTLKLEGADGTLATYTGAEAPRMLAKIEWFREHGGPSRAVRSRPAIKRPGWRSVNPLQPSLGASRNKHEPAPVSSCLSQDHPQAAAT